MYDLHSCRFLQIKKWPSKPYQKKSECQEEKYLTQPHQPPPTNCPNTWGSADVVDLLNPQQEVVHVKIVPPMHSQAPKAEAAMRAPSRSFQSSDFPARIPLNSAYSLEGSESPIESKSYVVPGNGAEKERGNGQLCPPKHVIPPSAFHCCCKPRAPEPLHSLFCLPMYRCAEGRGRERRTKAPRRVSAIY